MWNRIRVVINSEPSYELDEDNFRLVISLEQSKQISSSYARDKTKNIFLYNVKCLSQAWNKDKI